MSQQRKQWKPPFGKKYGLLYPTAWRILASREWWSVSEWRWLISKEISLGTDFYILAWWIFEIISLWLCSTRFHWNGNSIWWVLGPLIYRFGDIIFRLLSFLWAGYREKGKWVSVNRLMLLVTMNAIEIMFIFAFLYRAFGVMFPEIGTTDPPLQSFFHALYFSVVTGTTLGYGAPAPKGWLSQLLAMVETLSVLLVVITLIGYITGIRRTPDVQEREDIKRTEKGSLE